MRLLRTAEVACGLLGALAALLAVGWLLVVPVPVATERVAVSSGGAILVPVKRLLLEELGAQRAISLLLTIALLGVMLALAALLHGPGRVTFELPVLWLAPLALLLLNWLAVPYAGPLLVPAGLMGLAAATVGTRLQAMRGRP